MHTSRRSRILFTAVATLAFAAAPLRAADAAAPADAKPAAPAPTAPVSTGNYTINLSPAVKVGQKFATVSDLTSNNTAVRIITLAGVPTPQTQNQAQLVVSHLEADGEVLAVFPNGSIKKVALTVTSMNATMNSQNFPGLPAAGAKIVIEKDDADEETITVDGKASTGLINEVISAPYFMGSAKNNFQDIFGPKSPVAVGATWPVNTDGFLASQKNFPDADKVAGNIKLDGVTGSGDDQVVTFSGKIDTNGINLKLPAIVTVKSADLTTTVSGSIPVNTTKGVQSESMVNNLSAVAEGSAPDGSAQVKMTLTGVEKRTVKTTYR